MMPADGLTIITVCYQAADQLRQTLANIAAIKQTDVSYLVIDGGSTDGTVELLCQSDGVVDRWLSEPDKGIYDAMNKGWALADPASRILFLGAGDRILSLPQDLSRYGGEEIIYGDVMIGERRFHSVSDYRFRFSNTIHHQALLVPKWLHPEPPFDTAFHVYADYDFSLRLMKRAARFVFDPALLGYAEPGGVSSSKHHQENFLVVKKNLGLAAALCSATFLTIRKLLECAGIRALTP